MASSKLNLIFAIITLVLLSGFTSLSLAQTYTWDTLPTCGQICLKDMINTDGSNGCDPALAASGNLTCVCSTDQFQNDVADCLDQVCCPPDSDCTGSNKTMENAIEAYESAFCSNPPAAALPTLSSGQSSAKATQPAPSTSASSIMSTITESTTELSTVSIITTVGGMPSSTSTPSIATAAVSIISLPFTSSATPPTLSTPPSITSTSPSSSSTTTILWTSSMTPSQTTSSTTPTAGSSAYQGMGKNKTKQLSVGATVGIGLGSGFGAMLLLTAFVLAIRRYRQKQAYGIVKPDEPPYGGKQPVIVDQDAPPYLDPMKLPDTLIEAGGQGIAEKDDDVARQDLHSPPRPVGSAELGGPPRFYA